jgi:hypothetical protein
LAKDIKMLLDDFLKGYPAHYYVDIDIPSGVLYDAQHIIDQLCRKLSEKTGGVDVERTLKRMNERILALDSE